MKFERIDLTGQRFGMLTVIEADHSDNKRGWWWKCICDCGNERIVPSGNLRSGSTISCGCYKRGNEKYDIKGQRFGRLIAEYRLEDRITKGGRKIPRWHCVCDCGNEKDVDLWHLRSGAVVSCGCYWQERRVEANTIHGMNGTRFYNVWAGMKSRCDDENATYYGAKGIKVCERWSGEDGFQNFYDDMYETYRDGLTIDRIDYNGDYEPSNCRWADAIMQANNTSRNRYVTIDGITHTLTEWARIKGINTQTLKDRVYKRGMNPIEAILKPVRPRRKPA